MENADDAFAWNQREIHRVENGNEMKSFFLCLLSKLVEFFTFFLLTNAKLFHVCFFYSRSKQVLALEVQSR